MRYLVTIQLKSGADMDRLKNDVPILIGGIDRASRGEREAFFRSSDGTLFGFFVKSQLPAGAVRAEVENTTGFIGGDSVLVVEIGDTFEGSGFSRAWTWLQRHKSI